MPIVVTSPVTAVVVGADSLGDGSAGAPVVSFLSDQTTGVYLSAGATVGVACGGLVKFEFSAAALNCHNIPLTNVGDITCKSTGQAIINLNAVTGIAAGVPITAVASIAGIAAGQAISVVASVAGLATGMAVSAVGTFAGIGAGAVCTAVASIAGIAAGMDVTATKTIVGIAAGVDISAVKSLAFIGGLGAITNCSSIDSPDATTSVHGQMPFLDKLYLDRSHAAAGTDLTDTATQSIAITGGGWRKLPLLGQGGTLTLATTGAVAGDQIEITRSDAHAFTYAIVNGGTGAGTLYTMAASKIGCAKFQFDGTDWALRSFGVQ